MILNANSPNPRLWLDLETTGLNPREDEILEVAAIMTTPDLRELGRFSVVVHHDWQIMAGMMNRMVFDMHYKSGLLDECMKVEPNKVPITISKAEALLCDFVVKHAGTVCPVCPILCGNSIGSLDRPFLREHMTSAESLLHYRMIDVSGMREFFRGLGIACPEGPKEKPHRAMADVEASLELGRFFADFRQDSVL